MRGMVVEWAPFRLAEGVNEKSLLEASAALQSDFLERQDGFVSRELLRGEDGGWCDLVFWRDRASVDAAMAHVAESPVCARYFSYMVAADPTEPHAGVHLFDVRGSYGSARPAATAGAR